MRSKHVRIVTYTGVMIAIALLFQSLRLVFPGLAIINFFGVSLLQIIIGTLVNLCLLITLWNVGLVSGLLLSALAPVVAFMQGQAPIPHMIAVIALGNAVYCLIAWVPFAKAKTRFFLTMVAALSKFGLMALLVLKLVIPVLLPAAVTSAPKVDAITAALSVNFVWPQLINAVIGGLLAYTISPRLPKAAE